MLNYFHQDKFLKKTPLKITSLTHLNWSVQRWLEAGSKTHKLHISCAFNAFMSNLPLVSEYCVVFISLSGVHIVFLSSITQITQGEMWLWASFLNAVGSDDSTALLHNMFSAFAEKDICTSKLYIFLASSQVLSHLTWFFSWVFIGKTCSRAAMKIVQSFKKRITDIKIIILAMWHQDSIIQRYQCM